MAKSCVKRLLQTFHENYESLQLEYADQKKVLRRSVNCSQKVYALQELDKVRLKQKNSTKRKRVNYEKLITFSRKIISTQKSIIFTPVFFLFTLGGIKKQLH